MNISKSLALVVALVGSLWGVSVAHAKNHKVFAAANLSPIPGSGYNAGGGGVLYTDGSANGTFTHAVTGSQTVNQATMLGWSSGPVDSCDPPSGGICLCFDFTSLPEESFHITRCLPLQFGENTNVTDDPVIITVSQFN
ncbi:MAG TPA: hypothetical protein VGG03_05415 [Thermoanaerobaculia bacterium]|jgi:hypothetical protein